MNSPKFLLNFLNGVSIKKKIAWKKYHTEENEKFFLKILPKSSRQQNSDQKCQVLLKFNDLSAMCTAFYLFALCSMTFNEYERNFNNFLLMSHLKNTHNSCSAINNKNIHSFGPNVVQLRALSVMGSCNFPIGASES